MYPKGVSDFVLDQPRLREQFATSCLPPTGDLNSRPLASHYPDDTEFEAWLAREGHRQDPAIRGYLFYLRTLSGIFDNVRFAFERAEALEPGDDDLLFTASYLYYLDSYQVRGDVIDCGSEGVSSCCLSWACSLLGRRLAVLTRDPDKVDLDLIRFGRRESVDLVLGGLQPVRRVFRRPLALIRLDRELGAAARGALEHTFERLERRGVVFSGGFAAEDVSPAFEIVATTGVPGAVRAFFDAGGHPCTARHLTDGTAIVVPRTPAESKPVLSPRKHVALMRLLRSQRR